MLLNQHLDFKEGVSISLNWTYETAPFFYGSRQRLDKARNRHITSVNGRG